LDLETVGKELSADLPLEIPIPVLIIFTLSYKVTVVKCLLFIGVYRRFRFNEELVQSPPTENSADSTPNDMHVDVTPPPEAQGRFQFSAFTFSQGLLILTRRN